ncbi:MAG: hypothetical protein NZ889_01620 [Candidatus Pacearchaeota archaeon]|nr:hypothetical protein [Candidatus Pacearchaeota archaeon]
MVKRISLKEALKQEGFLEKAKILPRSFDVIGKIAIIQIPTELKKKAKRIAKKLLEIYKNIEAVYERGKHKGFLRKQAIRWLAGKKIEETIHKEYGCIFKLNVKNCFFSPRLATDRMEIAKQVKKGEKILIMFAGVAPYAIIIAKHTNPKKIICIEINRIACKYARENILLNKIKNVEIIEGDAKKLAKIIRKGEKFDRIVMPRPQIEYDFLQEALLVAKKGTIIHFHDFVNEKEIGKAVEKIRNKTKKFGRKIKVLKIKKVREIGPRKLNIRIDFKIIK